MGRHDVVRPGFRPTLRLLRAARLLFPSRPEAKHRRCIDGAFRHVRSLVETEHDSQCAPLSLGDNHVAAHGFELPVSSFLSQGRSASNLVVDLVVAFAPSDSAPLLRCPGSRSIPSYGPRHGQLFDALPRLSEQTFIAATWFR